MTSAFPNVSFVTGAAVQPSSPETGLERRVGAYNENLFLAEHRMEKGWAGAVHSHPHDQVVYVVSGHLLVTWLMRTINVAGAGPAWLMLAVVE
jgi:quercetin dioxygenase-like cupin family protein